MAGGGGLRSGDTAGYLLSYVLCVGLVSVPGHWSVLNVVTFLTALGMCRRLFVVSQGLRWR